jgi:hypothetical protein
LRTRLLITDALGSVLAQIKPDGSQAASYVYSPYGQTRVSVAGGELSLGGSSLNATEANASLYTAREYEGTNLGTVAPGDQPKRPNRQPRRAVLLPGAVL